MTQHRTRNANVAAGDSQRERQLRLDAACARLEQMNLTDAMVDDTDRRWMKNVLVDPEYQFLYCVVPKAGCTNMKRSLALLNEKLGSGFVAKETLVMKSRYHRFHCNTGLWYKCQPSNRSKGSDSTVFSSVKKNSSINKILGVRGAPGARTLGSSRTWSPVISAHILVFVLLW